MTPFRAQRARKRAEVKHPRGHRPTGTPNRLVYTSAMAIAMNELTHMLMKLPQKQRAQLVANLLASLPSVLADQDEGVAEALRRDAELQDGTEQALSLKDFDAAIRNRRRG